MEGQICKYKFIFICFHSIFIIKINLIFQVSCICNREACEREPNAKEIYNKELLKMNALGASEGELLILRIWGKPDTDEAMSVGVSIKSLFKCPYILWKW